MRDSEEKVRQQAEPKISHMERFRAMFGEEKVTGEQSAKDPPRKAAEADPGPSPTPTVSAEPEAAEVAQEAPRPSGRSVRATPRPQHPQEYADSEENLAQWREDVFRGREQDNDGDTPSIYATEVEVDA